MQVQSPTIRYPKKTVRFGGPGGSGAGMMDTVVNGVDATFRKIGASRGREMIVEDLMGFGFLRTGMDLMRGYFFGNGTLNIPAAGERLFREASSIFTDNVLSGVAAWGIGKHFDKTRGAFSNGFTDFPTVELFQQAVKNGAKDEKQFLQWISQRLVSTKGNSQAGLSADQLREILHDNVWKPKQFTEAARIEQATSIAKKLGLDRFDVQIGKQTFKLENLLDDLRIFKNHMGKRMRQGTGKSSSWATVAKNSIEQTLKVKNYKLLCIGLGMASTFAVPFINVGLTKMLYGLDYYPGEMGLRKPDKKQTSAGDSPYGMPNQPKRPSFFEKHFPYVMNSLRNGNWLPGLLAALPLPFALGFFNTATMRFVKPWKRNVLRNMFDFCKEAPFTAQQQMASIFALLITSRLLCARSDNEFRERMVDSFLGWGLWILGTPLMKKAVAAYLDKNKGTVLQKMMPDGSTALRTRAEIENLLKEGVAVAAKDSSQLVSNAVSKNTIMVTRKAHILLGAGSTVMSMILLGIIEPWLGIHWTRYNEKQKEQAAKAQTVTNAGAQTFNGYGAGGYRPSFPSGFVMPGQGTYPQVYPWPPQAQNAYAWAQRQPR